jgi:hypothetical protein
MPGAGNGGGDFIGSSYSIYDRESRAWRQMWVDNSGSMFYLRGGPVEGQRHIFELVNIEPRPADRGVRRMIWEDVKTDSYVWRWQEQKANGSWSDLWVIDYRRRNSAD